MQLTIEIESQNELQLLLQYLRFMPTAKILKGPSSVANSTNVEPSSKRPKKDLSKYWGSLPNDMTLDEVDEKITKMREEWVRDIY